METTKGRAARFGTLGELTAAHIVLLKRELESGPDGGVKKLLGDIKEFLERGQATGTLLDDDQDRRATQSLLNYWVTVLYRAGVEPPYAILAPYDAQQAEKDLSATRCPYVGLNPFRAEDREYFFGREKMTKAVVGDLASKPLAVIVGPSGSGKSSLLHAGILPALGDGVLLPESQGWRRYPPIMPGRTPLASMTQMLRSLPPEGAADAPPEVEAFKLSGTALIEYLDRPGAPPALICIDQFEEVFTVCKSDEEREPFLNNLLGVVKSPGVRHKLVLTMRSDRAGYVLRRSELNESFHEAEVRLPPLTEDEMRGAVEGPARRVGLVVKAGVVEQLVKEIYGDPSGLPLLQFTLLKLWEQKERGSITLASLRRLGDCRKALADSADQFYERLERRGGKEVARRVLLKMVRLSEGLEMTSNRVRRGELYEAIKDPPLIDEVLRRLDEAHLVRITRAGTPAPVAGDPAGEVQGVVQPSEDDQFELAHESLMYTWPKLEDWLKQGREAMILQQHLETYVAEWVLSGRGQDALLDKYKLHEAKRWLAQHDPSESSHGDDLRELVRVSESAINWAKGVRRALTAALIITLLVAVLVAWQAMSESRRAFSRQLAAQALINKSEHLDLALLLSLEAIRIEKNEEISSVSATSLLQTLNHSPKLIAFLHPLGPGADGSFSPGIKSVAFDSAGSKLASYDERGTVIIWDVEGRKELRRFAAKLEGELVSTAFSANGGLLALRYRDNTVVLWDVNSGERQRSLDISPPRKEAGGKGQRGGDPGAPEARPVDTINPEEPDYFEVRDKPAERDSGITFSQYGETLIANYPDEEKTIIPWDVGGLGVKESPVLAGQKRQPASGRGVLAQALSPGLTRLAVVRKESSMDNATAEVRTAEGANRALISLPGVLQDVVGVESLAFSPDEKMLACLYRDFNNVHTLVLWDIEGEKRELLFKSPIRPRNNSVEPLIAFAPDGRLAIASSVGNVTLLDNTRRVNPEGLALLPTGSMGVINSIAFGFGGHRLAAGYQDGTILLWDYALPRERIGAVTPHQNEEGIQRSVYGLIFDVDGGRLVSASIDGDSVAVSRAVSGHSEDKQSITTFSLESATDVNATDTHPTDISFSPDGKVAALNYGKRVVLRDASGGAERGEFKEGNKTITTVALSRGGRRVSAGYDDGSATVWEVESGRKLADIPHGSQGESQIDEVAGIALNAEGTLCAVGGSSGALRLWDVGKGDGVQLAKATGETRSMNLVFSPDGKQLISFDDLGEISFREIPAEPTDRPLTVPGLYVESVAFSPDGKLMVTASRAGEGILWDMETHKQLGKLFLDKGGNDVSAVAYRAAGNLLAVGYSSGEIILFDISPRKFQELACQIANRQLSDDERRYYQLRKGDWRHLGLGDWSSYFGGGQVSPTCPGLP